MNAVLMSVEHLFAGSIGFASYIMPAPQTLAVPVAGVIVAALHSGFVGSQQETGIAHFGIHVLLLHAVWD